MEMNTRKPSLREMMNSELNNDMKWPEITNCDIRPP